MPGETDHSALLRSAQPALVDGEYVFVCVANADAARALSPRGLFFETEGVTAICTADAARVAGVSFEGVFRQITLQIASSLHAVGFLAALTAALAREGIACNAVSAFHHDHLFVPAADAARALAALRKLTEKTHPVRTA